MLFVILMARLKHYSKLIFTIKKVRPRVVALFFIAFTGAKASAQVGASITFDALYFSDFVAFEDIDELQNTQSGTYLYFKQTNQFTKRLWQDWDIGVLFGREGYLNFSRDTAKIYPIVELDQAFPADSTQNYLVKLAANVLEYQAFTVAKRFTLGDWSIKPRLRLLQSQHLYYGNLVGEFTTFSEKDFAFKGWVNYYYADREIFLERSNFANPDGLGIVQDIQFVYNSRPISAYLDINALFSHIEWSNVPRSQLNFNVSNRSDTQANLFNATAGASGVESIDATLITHIPTSYESGLDVSISKSTLIGLRLIYLERHIDYGVSLCERNRPIYCGQYWLASRSFAISANWEFASLRLQAQHLNSNFTFSLSMGIHI